MTRRPLRPERTNEGPGAALNRIRGTREVPSPFTAATAGLIKLSEAEDLGLSIRVRFTPQIGRRRTGTLTVIQLENYC